MRKDRSKYANVKSRTDTGLRTHSRSPSRTLNTKGSTELFQELENHSRIETAEVKNSSLDNYDSALDEDTEFCTSSNTQFL
jgi:hypothetical protein